MSKRIAFHAAVTAVALVVLPAASQAHCLGYKHMRSEVVGAVDGVGHFVTRVADRTVKFGDRVFGWLHCDKRA